MGIKDKLGLPDVIIYEFGIFIGESFLIPYYMGLRRLEIVFMFPRLVQILFQIQFGLSYQYEIYNRYK